MSIRILKQAGTGYTNTYIEGPQDLVGYRFLGVVGSPKEGRVVLLTAPEGERCMIGLTAFSDIRRNYRASSERDETLDALFDDLDE